MSHDVYLLVMDSLDKFLKITGESINNNYSSFFEHFEENDFCSNLFLHLLEHIINVGFNKAILGILKCFWVEKTEIIALSLLLLSFDIFNLVQDNESPELEFGEGFVFPSN